MLVVEAVSSLDVLAELHRVLANYDVEIRGVEVKRTDDPNRAVVEMDVKLLSESLQDQVTAQLSRTAGIQRVSWA